MLWRPVAVIATLGLWLVPLRGHAQGPIAIIVSLDNPVSAMRMEELRRLYLGTTTSLGGRDGVILLESPKSRVTFYRALMGRSEEWVRRHWINVVFAGENAVPPKELRAAHDLKQFVADHAEAIAFIEAAEVDKTVKVLALDGYGPGDPNYPLR